MAEKLLIEHQSRVELPGGDLRPTSHPAGGAPPKPMNRESQVSVAVLLFLLTVAAVVFAGFNFNAELKFLAPKDGVWWVEHRGRPISGLSPATNWFRSMVAKSRTYPA